MYSCRDFLWELVRYVFLYSLCHIGYLYHEYLGVTSNQGIFLGICIFGLVLYIMRKVIEISLDA